MIFEIKLRANHSDAERRESEGIADEENFIYFHFANPREEKEKKDEKRVINRNNELL
jgi:hypothetical protein